MLTGAIGGEDYLVSLLFTGWNRFVFLLCLVIATRVSQLSSASDAHNCIVTCHKFGRAEALSIKSQYCQYRAPTIVDSSARYLSDILSSSIAQSICSIDKIIINK